MEIIIPNKNIALQYALNELDYSNNLMNKVTSQDDICNTTNYIDDVYSNTEKHKIFSIDNKAIIILDIDDVRKFVVVECCYTSEDARGNGYAGQLLQHAIKFWRDNYFGYRLILAVVKTNYNAIKLYNSNGFRKKNSDNNFNYMEYNPLTELLRCL